ncbi:adhesin biosynthesis transcription regulatory family protein [Escherichia coli]|uniref:adhesin biosynthesis transcription regulatory family protein n=1 Tax=Escherichia coli TaxID=562 RepID=UPI001F18E7EA|nr:adhesin biosynthesis transcription regulatory family protein [Escherichia coli]MCF7465342.1 adhesin biosynthesis transcription regulatory family protein [Escherichia coli]MED0526363.1 adhesin biosynthesis transcription regulatory family protein [Escherichia coli]HBB9157390.1 transcriptional regulator [Escherichia coli]
MFDTDRTDSSKYQGRGHFVQLRNRKGELSDEQFYLLVELASVRSQKVILAMRDHFVLGYPRKVVCEGYGVNAGYLSVCIGRLNRVETMILKLVHFYC